jgi:hypothetical protein
VREHLRDPNVTEEVGVAPQCFWRRLAKACALLLVGAVAHLWLPSMMQQPPRAVADAARGDAIDGRASNIGGAPPVETPSVFTEPRAEVEPLDLISRAVQMTPAVAASDDVQLVPVGTSGRRAERRASAAPTASPADAPRVVVEPPQASAAEPPTEVVAEPERDRGQETVAPEPVEVPLRSNASPATTEGTPAPAVPAVERAAPPAQEDSSAALPSLMPAGALRPLATIEPPAEEGIQRVLQAYQRAFERLDAAAAKHVWPTVDARALGHAFSQLSEQRLTFDACGISVSGDAASARCRGQAESLPKVGGRRAFVTSGEWVFDLAKRESDWQIVAANVK